ncbi:MAG: hypothetical protein JKY95_08620 [Planctomycetaceae bacterium]|nr:hypothetical protein [Planctomycetaceae bacterium]
MPSYRVNESSILLSIYDVVGQDGKLRDFIEHTGLAASAGSYDAKDKTPIFDMGPPLHGNDNLSRMKISVVGVANLTDDEERKIKTFLDRHAAEHAIFQKIGRKEILRLAPQMYCVYPHVSKLREEDDRYPRMRFSCVGFVFEAYKKARIRLLEKDTLPDLDMDLIRKAYRVQARWIDQGKIKLEDLGFEGDGPWPVMLCGYLFHAFNRTSSEIRTEPYIPYLEDQSFI